MEKVEYGPSRDLGGRQTKMPVAPIKALTPIELAEKGIEALKEAERERDWPRACLLLGRAHGAFLLAAHATLEAFNEQNAKMSGLKP